MSDAFGAKLCKYCGSYYSPEGTWHKENENDVCDECWKKYFSAINGTIHYHREEIKKKWFQKILPLQLMRSERGSEKPEDVGSLPTGGTTCQALLLGECNQDR